MISLDFSDTKTVEEVQWKPLEDGEYEFVIADCTVKPSADAEKSPSLKVILQWVEDAKYTIWHWQYLDQTNEKSMAYLKDFLEKVYDEEISGDFQLDPTDLVGRHVRAIVTQQPRQDKPTQKQNVVSSFIASPF